MARVSNENNPIIAGLTLEDAGSFQTHSNFLPSDVFFHKMSWLVLPQDFGKKWKPTIFWEVKLFPEKKSMEKVSFVNAYLWHFLVKFGWKRSLKATIYRNKIINNDFKYHKSINHGIKYLILHHSISWLVKSSQAFDLKWMI